jgi:hypothetical protein
LEDIQETQVLAVGISAARDRVSQRLLSVQKHLSCTDYQRLLSTILAVSEFVTSGFC